MADIFQSNHKKNKLRDKFYYYTFYTVLLYLLALLVAVVSKPAHICIGTFCAGNKEQLFISAFILYLYLLFFVVLLIYTYKLLEKLVAHKNHIRYFKYIFIAIPVLTGLFLWLSGTHSDDALLFLVFSAVLSVIGLLMIELRNNKTS